MAKISQRNLRHLVMGSFPGALAEVDMSVGFEEDAEVIVVNEDH